MTAALLSLLLAGCAGSRLPARSQALPTTNSQLVGASYVDTWNAALMTAQQSRYSIVLADRGRGRIVALMILPGGQVGRYALDTERYMGVTWWELDTTLTIRVEPAQLRSFGGSLSQEAGGAQTRVRASVTLFARGNGRRIGTVEIPLPSNGALEQQYLNSLLLVTQLEQRRADGPVEEAMPARAAEE